MKNIYLLKTDKPSRLLVRNDKPSILMLKEHSPFATNETHTYQNIYILSDEEIKDGDWCIDINSNQPFQCLRNQKDGVYEWKDGNSWARLHKNCKKIILTTDQDLIADGVQPIDDDFLEWFTKNTSCEEVKVYYDLFEFEKDSTSKNYKIIIPKTESKFENSIENTINFMNIANSMFSKKEKPKQEMKIGDNTNFGIITDIKEYSVCFGKNSKGVDIWYKKSSVELKNKQETLETANKIYPNERYNDEIYYNTSKVTRVEVIQHSPPYNGRAYTNYDAKDVEIQLQDDDKTLKIFLK